MPCRISNLLRILHLSVVRQFELLLLVALCLHIMATAVECAESRPDVHYIKSGSGTIMGTLVPEIERGLVCYTCSVLKVKVDGKEIHCEIKPVEGGRAEVLGEFVGLEDGPHTATEQALGNGKIKANNRVLFIVDTKPPVLELIEPTGDTITLTQTTFLVKFSDEVSGIPPDVGGIKVEARINDSPATANVSEKNGERFLLIESNGPKWEPNQSVSLDVMIEDRAGHTAELTKRFKTETKKEDWDLKWVRCPGHTDSRSIFVLRRLSFPLLTPLKNIVFDLNTRSTTLEMMLASPDGKPLDEDIFDALQITSNHPNIKVERLRRLPESSAAKFKVNQIAPAGGGDNLGSITVQYPEAVVFDHYVSCENGEARATIKEMSTDGGIIVYKIPVSLYWQDRFSEELLVVGENLKYRFFFDGQGGIDAAASWFELDGEKYWLKEAGEEAYGAEMPAYEGYRDYKVALTLSRGAWSNDTEGQVTNNGTCLKKEGELFVKLGAPVIEAFLYDREKERFRAVISDKGTELEDLVLSLYVAGGGEITAMVDTLSGGVEAEYPIPTGIHEATLSVTDMAGQMTRATCKVFGHPAEPDQAGEGEGGYPVTLKVNAVGHGMRPRSPEFNLFRKYLDEYRGGKQRVRECRSSFVMDKPHPFVFCIRAALAAGKSDSEALSQCERLGRHNKMSLNAKLTCTEKWIDTLGPRILDISYDPGSEEFLARIDDHGGPLSDLTFDFIVNTGPTARSPRSLRPSYSFNTKNGSFRGRAGLPDEYELFNATITATDRVGNYTWAYLDVRAPRSPPDVTIQVLKQKAGFSLSGTNLSTCLMAQCDDISGINHNMTRVFIDGHSIMPSAILQDLGDFPDRVLFRAGLEEGDHTARIHVTDNVGLSSEDTLRFNVSSPPEIRDFKTMPASLQLAGGPAFTAIILDLGRDLGKEGLVFEIDGKPVPRDRLFYDPYSGYFSVDGPFDFSPDRHQAHVAATDDHGNRKEQYLTFIPGERVLLPAAGAGEVRLEEITLWEIQDHNGDGRANPGELVRLFVTLRNTGSSPLEGVVGQLTSEEDLISVEGDRVDYGRIDAGSAPLAVRGFDIRIDEGILDSTPSNPYDTPFNLKVASTAGQSWFLPFTLPVYKPTIPITAPSSPSQVNLSIVSVKIDSLPPTTDQAEIEVTGTASSSASVMDRVTVYANGNPFDAAFDAGNGCFSVTVPLVNHGNMIEAQATDRSGAMGIATAFINRFIEPPQVTITDPVDGHSCQGPCLNMPYLYGTFSTGGSKLASIEGRMIHANGPSTIFPVSACEGMSWCWTAYYNPCVGCEGPGQIYTHDYLPCPGFGHADIVVTITTMDGDTATDVVHIYLYP